jgi:hypothetical protein
VATMTRTQAALASWILAVICGLLAGGANPSLLFWILIPAGFLWRFNGQIAFSRRVDLTSPRSGAGVANLGGGSHPAYGNGNCPIIVQPTDPRKLNRLFVERLKGGDAKRPGLRDTRNEGGSNPPSVPSPDSVEALYASGKASSLKEALAILGGR